jgi:hypothetical protein
VAEQLLNALDKTCIEEAVYMDCSSIAPAALKDLADSCGVTLRPEPNNLIVLGRQEAVKHAMKNIHRYLNNPEKRDGNFSEKKRVAQSSTPAQKGGGSHAAGICPACRTFPFCEACGYPRTIVDNAEVGNKMGACLTCGACPQCAACGTRAKVAKKIPHNSDAGRASTTNAQAGNTAVSTPNLETPWVGTIGRPMMSREDHMVPMGAARTGSQNMIPAAFIATPDMMQGQHPHSYMPMFSQSYCIMPIQSCDANVHTDQQQSGFCMYPYVAG